MLFTNMYSSVINDEICISLNKLDKSIVDIIIISNNVYDNDYLQILFDKIINDLFKNYSHKKIDDKYYIKISNGNFHKILNKLFNNIHNYILRYVDLSHMTFQRNLTYIDNIIYIRVNNKKKIYINNTKYIQSMSIYTEICKHRNVINMTNKTFELHDNNNSIIIKFNNFKQVKSLNLKRFKEDIKKLLTYKDIILLINLKKLIDLYYSTDIYCNCDEKEYSKTYCDYNKNAYSDIFKVKSFYGLKHCSDNDIDITIKDIENSKFISDNFNIDIKFNNNSNLLYGCVTDIDNKNNLIQESVIINLDNDIPFSQLRKQQKNSFEEYVKTQFFSDYCRELYNDFDLIENQEKNICLNNYKKLFNTCDRNNKSESLALFLFGNLIKQSIPYWNDHISSVECKNYTISNRNINNDNKELIYLKKQVTKFISKLYNPKTQLILCYNVHTENDKEFYTNCYTFIINELKTEFKNNLSASKNLNKVQLFPVIFN